MKKLSKRIKKIVAYSLFLSLLLTVIFAYSIFSNNAPFKNGKVEYGVNYNDKQTVDIYYPTENVFEKSPLVIFYHGGAWIAGRKESINFNRFNLTVNLLREQGYTVLSPSYTLANLSNSPFPTCIQDAFDLMFWVEKNAPNYNFDTTNIGAFGESAGAHIALMTGLSKPEDFSSQSSSIKVKYIVDVYGPTELESLYQLQHSDSSLIFSKLPLYLQSKMDFSELIYGFDPLLHKEDASLFTKKYSPLNYVSENTAPILIIHGDADQLVPLQQSLILKESLNKFGKETELLIIKNANHGFFGASDIQKKELQVKIVDFIKKQYSSQ